MKTSILADIALADTGVSLAGLLPAFGSAQSIGQLHFASETWKNETVTIAGFLEISSDNSVNVAGFSLQLGLPSDVPLHLPFSVVLPRVPFALVLFVLMHRSRMLEPEQLAKAEVELAIELGMDESTVAEELKSGPEALIDSIVQASDLASVSLTVGPISAWISPPEDWLMAGRHVKNAAGEIIGVEPAPGIPIMVPLGSVSLTLSAQGVSLDMNTPDSLTFPPIMLADTGLAIELRDLVLKLSDGPLPPAMAGFSASDGFDAEWRGVYAGQITLWNLDKVFPGGPKGNASAANGAHIEATGLAIDERGLTGNLSWQRRVQSDETLALQSVDIGFDRNWYPLSATGRGRLDLSDDGGDILEYVASLELDPFATDGRPWRLDVAVQHDDPTKALMEASDPGAFLALSSVAAVALGDGDLALLLAALAAGKRARILECNSIALTSASLSGALGPDGFSLSSSLSVRTDLEIIALDDPVPLALGAGGLEVGYDSSSGFSAQWSLSKGLDLVFPMEVDIAGQATLSRIALRRRDNGHLVIELGVEADGAGDMAIGGLPNVMSLVYDPVNDRFLPPEFSRDGQELTILVPGTLYAKGRLRQSESTFPQVGPLRWGDTLTASLTVHLIGNGQAIKPEDHLEPSSYLYTLDLGLLTATREDGMKALVVTGDLSFSPGLPLGSTGVALYGLGLTYAQNAEPSAQNGNYTGWFLETSPKFSTTATKWRPQADNWGFGASVTLGSQPDDGRAWNVAAGLFLLLPGPVIMVTGKGSLFSPPPALPTGDEGASIDAPFGAAVALDMLRNRFTAELDANLDISAAGQDILKLQIPAKVNASLTPPLDMELSIGSFMPEDARVKGRALGLYDIGAYIVVSTSGIDDFPKPGMRLAPFAMAYGGSGGLSAGFSSSIAELKLSVQAGFDLGVSLANPPLMAGRVYVDGSLMARIACVRLNIGLRTDLMVVAPQPFELSGTAKLRVNLPWPIPDIRFSGSFRIGTDSDWPNGYPKPEDPTADISLFPRPNGTATLASGESLDALVLSNNKAITGVPLDAGLLVAFRAPMGNEDPQIGMTATQADDRAAPVWEIASEGSTKDGQTLRVGWRHVLTKLELREAGQPIPVKAGWSFQAAAGTTRDSVNTAPGGQGDRRAVYVMAPLDAPVERRYGTGADVLDDMVEGWQPCAQVPNIKDMENAFIVPDHSSLGIDRPHERIPAWLPADSWHLLEQSGLFASGDVRIRYETPPRGISMVYPGHDTHAPLVLGRPDGVTFRAKSPLDKPPRVLTLPSAVFSTQRDIDHVLKIGTAFSPPAGRLLIEFPVDSEVRALYFLVRDGTHLDVRTIDNQAIEAHEIYNSRVYAGDNERWSLMRIIPEMMIDRLSVAAIMMPHEGGKIFGSAGAVLVGASFFAHDLGAGEAVARRRESSLQLVSDLAQDAAGWASGGSDALLKPGTNYELVIAGESHHARQIGEGTLETKGAPIPFTRTVKFRTEEDISQPLQPRMPATVWAPDKAPSWSVNMLPGEGGRHYRADPLNVVFADAVTAGRISAHGRSLRLDLVHESGQFASEQAAQVLADVKKKQSRLQDIVADYIEGQPCFTDHDPIWLSLVHRFSTVLKKGRYEASLVAQDESGGREPVVLHNWRFYASQWMNISDHLDDHEIRIIPQTGDADSAARSASQLISLMPERIGDGLLEDLLHGPLGHAPLAPSASPVILIPVRQDGFAWIVIDGPEPLLNEGVSVLVTQDGQNLAQSGVITNASATRAVICLKAAVSPGALTLQFSVGATSYPITFDVPAFQTFLERI